MDRKNTSGKSSPLAGVCSLKYGHSIGFAHQDSCPRKREILIWGQSCESAVVPRFKISLINLPVFKEFDNWAKNNNNLSVKQGQHRTRVGSPETGRARSASLVMVLCKPRGLSQTGVEQEAPNEAYIYRSHNHS